MPRSESFIRIDEACQELRLTKSTVYKLLCHRKLPFYKRGKYVFFDREELRQWLRAGRVSTLEEIEAAAATQNL